ncbi:hypothetical protein MRI28_30640 [Nocardiopsis dassonvillei]|uniref:hypothetical protein n=1 Tax=Nocardiopsis dassonvillei TaxID=2014 RepID=UPI002010527F|nr:hypothetical protein [Nocardiopsis dassonvillei]MCK9873928.1 hypothetical protein [Nocardiopsis dassonvillei]
MELLEGSMADLGCEAVILLVWGKLGSSALPLSWFLFIAVSVYRRRNRTSRKDDRERAHHE